MVAFTYRQCLDPPGFIGTDEDQIGFNPSLIERRLIALGAARKNRRTNVAQRPGSGRSVSANAADTAAATGRYRSVVVGAVFLGSRLWHGIFGDPNDYHGDGVKDVVVQVHSGDSTTAIGKTLLVAAR